MRRTLRSVATTEDQQRALSRRSYAPHEVEAGLQALVFEGGSARRAGRITGIPVSTLDLWLTLHRERLEVIRKERGPELERMAIEGFRAFVVRAEQVKAAALEATMDRIESGEVAEPWKAMQATAIAQGISVQRMLELDGRPSGVEPGRSLGELVAALERLGAVRTVEGSAVELGSGGDDMSCPTDVSADPAA